MVNGIFLSNGYFSSKMKLLIENTVKILWTNPITGCGFEC